MQSAAVISQPLLGEWRPKRLVADRRWITVSGWLMALGIIAIVLPVALTQRIVLGADIAVRAEVLLLGARALNERR